MEVLFSATRQYFRISNIQTFSDDRLPAVRMLELVHDTVEYMEGETTDYYFQQCFKVIFEFIFQH